MNRPLWDDDEPRPVLDSPADLALWLVIVALCFWILSYAYPTH